MNEQNTELQELWISPNSSQYLIETAKWSKFFSIVGFVFSGIMIFAALSLFFAAGMLQASMPEPFPFRWLAILYFGMSVIYFFPVLYLYRFASKIKHALIQKSQSFFEESLMNLKSHYKFIGILVAIMLVLYPIILVVAIIAGIASSF